VAGPDNWQQRYRMVYAGRQGTVTADSPDELLGLLVDGYLDIPEEDRHRARVTHAGRIRGRLQQRVLAAFGPSGLGPDEQREFLDEPEPTSIPPLWSADVPLILVGAHFADRPRPRRAAGRIVWLETDDDDGYLRSLAVAGEILLMVRQGVPDQEDPPGDEQPDDGRANPVGDDRAGLVGDGRPAAVPPMAQEA
jgi:hypothetical protein